MIFPPRSKFNFDTALRYQPVVDRIEKSRWRDKPVLEVGSGGSGISDYYHGKVIGVDMDFSKTGTEKNVNIKYVHGSVLNLPFNSQAFYLVVCLDTLEHISESMRVKAIKELLRVAKKGGIIFLGFPTSSLSIRFEDKINSLYKKKYIINHPWLLEHRKYGLPDQHKILSILRDLGIFGDKLVILKNVNLIIWFFIHFLFTVHPQNIFSRILKYAYVTIFYIGGINLPPFYRVILIINK